MKCFALSFAVVLVVAGCGGAKQEDVPKETPTADEVLEANVAAMGGRDAFAKLETIRVRAALTIEKYDVHGTMEISQKRPNLSYSRLEVSGAGVEEDGCDGTTCWERSDAEGVRIVQGEELEDKLRDAAIDSELRWRELWAKVEVAGPADFAGRGAWKVVFTPKQGKPETKYYDRKTHLELGGESIKRDQNGEAPMSMKVLDWKKFGPITYPSAVLMAAEGVEFRIEIRDIEINPSLPDSRFELPPEVKALRDQAAEAPAAP